MRTSKILLCVTLLAFAGCGKQPTKVPDWNEGRWGCQGPTLFGDSQCKVEVEFLPDRKFVLTAKNADPFGVSELEMTGTYDVDKGGNLLLTSTQAMAGITDKKTGVKRPELNISGKDVIKVEVWANPSMRKLIITPTQIVFPADKGSIQLPKNKELNRLP